MDNAPCGFMVLTNQGYIIDINQTFLKMIEYEYNEVVNKHIESFLSIASKLMFHTLFFLQIQINGKAEETYLTFKSRLGKEVPLLLNGSRASAELIDCIAVRMSKRDEYERELQDIKKKLEDSYIVETKLRELFETTIFSINEGIIVTDTQEKITLMNPASENYTGWSKREAYGKDFATVFNHINMLTREKAPNPVNELLEKDITKKECPINSGLVSRNGSEIYISGNAAGILSKNGKLTGVVVIFKNITKEYTQEKDIEGFLEVNLDILCVSDTTGNFHKVNRKFREILGYRAEEVEGKSLLSFVHEEDISDTLVVLGELNDGKMVSGFMNRYRHKDGTYRYIEWYSQPGAGKFIYSSARDVTEKQKKVTEALRLSEEKYQFITENMFDVVWVINLSKGKYTYISPSVEQQTGFSVEESLEQSLEDFMSLESVIKIRNYISAGMEHLKNHPDSSYSAINEIQKLCKNGNMIWVEASTRMLYNAEYEIEIIIASRNIEERKQAEALKYVSYHDQLTGLYNRHFLETIIGQEMESADRYNQPLSLAVLDLDHFKQVNDTWGHPIGDELLKLTADTAKKNLRASDFLIRFGGEEFVFLMPQTGIDGTVSALDKIRAAIENNNHPVTGKQTVSIGVAERIKTESFQDWYKRADKALYRAKQEGRNRIVRYS